MKNEIDKIIRKPDMAQIPDEMKIQRRWVCHNSRKEPINAKSGGLASATNKNSWSSFVEACTGKEKYSLSGMGFMLGDGFVGVDIDGCVENGEIATTALEIIERLQSYTEYSPSGTGIHIICKGTKPGTLCKVKTMPGSKALELYDKDRYFTVTGNAINVFGVEDRTVEIEWLYKKYFDKAKEVKANPITRLSVPLTDREENLACLSRGFEKDKKLKAFYEGEFNTEDESAKDLALMGKLLYWTNNDDELALETFLDSPFAISKDEEHIAKLDRNDYLPRTLEAARPFSTAAVDQQQYYQRNLGSDAMTGLDKLRTMKPNEKYSLDDRGNGDLFADFFRDTARFNATAGEWYVYTGRVWKKDSNGMRVARKAKELKDLLYPYCLTIRDDKEREQYLKHVGKMGSRTVRDTMLKDARDKYCFENENLDMNPKLMNCLNGTLNLETLEFREHRGDDLISRIAKVNYIPGAKSALWEKFINEVMMGDEGKIRYLQKAIGYGITADTSLETSYILYGASTRNGKSTLMETLMHLLGGSNGYSLQMKPETLAQKNNNDSRVASGDIARLHGARLLNVSEPPKKMIFDVALLKTLLGRDSIVARHLHEREFEFTPVFKLFMNTNYLPIINDDSLFASGRINVISFDRQFSEEEQDKTLKDRLKEKENLSGILNWCLDGLAAFRKEGLMQPESVKEATREYRQESDKLGKFMVECLEVSNENIQASVVYSVYENWCRACGYGCENQGNFYAELRTKKLMSKSGTVDGITKLRVVKGYSILPEWCRFTADYN